MKVLNKIEELLTLPGNKIAFFGGSFNPPHFGHLDFIKKATSINNLDHIIVCPQSDDDELGIEELHHRMRMMDLMVETTQASNIFVMSHEVCNGIQSQIFIDDIFYLLKRQNKEVFVLMGCDSFKKCADFFKSLDVTFIIGCAVKRSEVEKRLIAEKMKCVFIDDIIPCSAVQLKEDASKRDIYLSKELEEYMESNQLYWFNNDCENCN